MKIRKTASAEQIVEQALSNIKSGIATNGIGEKRSDYLSFLEDAHGNAASLDIIEETAGLAPTEMFYTVHLVDNIGSTRDCELFSTDSQSKENLLATVADIIETTIAIIADTGEIEIIDDSKQEVELNAEQLSRNDEIDNAAYQFILTLLEKSEDEFDWNMQYIGNVTDAAVSVLNAMGLRVRWPSVITDSNGIQHTEDYYEPEEATSTMDRSSKVEVETVFGTLTAEPASDPNYPGIYLYLKQNDGTALDAALFEATPERPTSGQSTLRLLVWGNTERDDFTDEFPFATADTEVSYHESKWVLTDDDSYQWVRKRSSTCFELIEISLINPELPLFHVYTDTLELHDYFVSKDRTEEVNKVLSGFGYKGLDDVNAQYGEEAMQVVAECIFEHYSSFQADVVYSGSENLCRKFIETYTGIGISGSRRLTESDISFEDEILAEDFDGREYLNFYLGTWFNVDEVFGTEVNTNENGDWLNVYANFDIKALRVSDYLDIIVNHEDAKCTELKYRLSDSEKDIILKKMNDYCMAREHKTVEQLIRALDEE